MKKVCSILCVIMAAFVMCAKATNDNDSAIIRGTLIKDLGQRGLAPDLRLYKGDNGVLKEVATSSLNAEHEFEFVVKEDFGLYYIGDIVEFYMVYVSPGDVVTLDINEARVTYRGNIGEENGVIKQWYDIMKELYTNIFPRTSMSILYADFAPKVDKVAPVVHDFIQKIHTKNKDFDSYMKFMLPHMFDFNVLLFLSKPHPDDPKKGDFSPYFVSMMDKTFDSMDLLRLPFLWNYIGITSFVKGAYYLGLIGEYTDLSLSMITDRQLKAEAALTIPCTSLEAYPEYEKKYKDLMVTEDQKTRFAAIRKNLQGLQKGDVAIDFAYPDKNGTVRHLSDFNGYVVLVDVWATWCGPCKAEIPFLKKLEDELKGEKVVFLSVSIDQEKDYEVWKNMIQEEHIGGIHLFAKGGEDLAKFYGVKSIPRFMVFDKDGKVVDINAPRPSDSALKEMILDELKK